MASSVLKAGYWYCNSELPIPVDSIPSKLFTHLFAAFADVDPSTYEVTFPEAYEVQFSTFTLTVQKKNKDVKTLLSIGGGVSSPSTFASMASDPNTRKSFIRSSISLARNNNFHGLSLNWEYPSTEGEMTNLGYLLNEWFAAVKNESKLTGNGPLLLVAAVNYRPKIHPTSLKYPVDVISRSLDWINVVAYDFYNPALSWNATGPFAALTNGHVNEENPRCADPGVRAWIDHGVPANKIVFGLPFYGAAWRLENVAKTDIFAPADGAADGAAEGVYINASDGTILYNQIRYFIDTHPAGNGQYSADFVVNFFSAGYTWIGYDDKESITAKVQYAKGKKLLGYYAWHLGGDRNWILSETAFNAWDKNAPGELRPALHHV